MKIRKHQFELAAAVLVASAAFWVGCNTNPVTFSQRSGVLNFEQTVNISGSEEIDILWVIDNSGSMCQEQDILGNNFNRFIGSLEGSSIDFNIAVTTTHMRDNYIPEPIARPGRIQSTPQPVPGFDRTCENRVDDDGQIVQGDFQPIRDAIATAVSCMENPNPEAFDWTAEEIRCALNMEPTCTLNGSDCGGNPCTAEDLFPDPSQYRSIPNVLRSDEYRDAGTLDTARLQADFRCMSLVGTRGNGIEKGLEAAVLATSPSLTGGPADVEAEMVGDVVIDRDAPNHGFLRQDSAFALIFVTDENDCTHDGTLNEETACNDAVCEYYNSTQLEGDSPLIDTEALKNALLDNLRASKGRPDLGEQEVIVASIHGRAKRYEGPILDDAACRAEDWEPPSAACASTLGEAFSGDRYIDFITQFERYYPPADDNGNVQGWMCSTDFSPALAAIGDLIRPLPSGCVIRDIFPCEGPQASCPNFVDGEAGTCTGVPNTDSDFYCNSGVQVRAELDEPTAENVQNLLDTGYCIEGTFGRPEFPNGCIISRDFYTWGSCGEGIAGIRLVWNNQEQALNQLAGTEIGIQYAALVGDG